MSTSTTLTIRLPVKTRKKLEKLAAATARSKSWLAANAIQEYVETEEWQVRAVRRGLADIKAGRVVPHEKVEAWLDSWGTDNVLPPP
jgi:predicted transcriptional regulator